MRRPEALSKEALEFCIVQNVNATLEEATRLGGWILPNVGFGTGEGIVRSYTEAIVWSLILNASKKSTNIQR
jgi:hypothetical protein